MEAAGSRSGGQGDRLRGIWGAVWGGCGLVQVQREEGERRLPSEGDSWEGRARLRSRRPVGAMMPRS